VTTAAPTPLSLGLLTNLSSLISRKSGGFVE
jgi:hypothetical protein